MSDGPMGVRQEFVDNDWKNVYDSDDTVTYLPSNSAIAATWNPKRAKECGEVLGAEARGRGKDVILAPGINKGNTEGGCSCLREAFRGKRAGDEQTVGRHRCR